LREAAGEGIKAEKRGIFSAFIIMGNLKLVIEYDGTDYHGWQKQDRHATIQGILEEKIGILTREAVTVIGSGRTDSGVHALHQVAHVRINGDVDCDKFRHAANAILPRDIVIKDVADVPLSFHARFNVTTKEYRYQIWNDPVPTALYRRYFWHIPNPLDVDSMEKGAGFLLGTHDFQSFCGAGSKIKDYIRTLHHITIEREGRGKIFISMAANGFMRHMVRNIVGTLVDVGRGKQLPQDVETIRNAQDRKRAGMTAPAHGLFLVNVCYE
jgi:tRNA pseudouridine38-40 synthase